MATISRKTMVRWTNASFLKCSALSAAQVYVGMLAVGPKGANRMMPALHGRITVSADARIDTGVFTLGAIVSGCVRNQTKAGGNSGALIT